MKDFILLIVAGAIVFSLSLIALYQWDKHIAYGKEYTELRQDIHRLDSEIRATEIRMNDLDRAIVVYWNKSKRR